MSTDARFRVQLTDAARDDLRASGDARTRQAVFSRALALDIEPLAQGKAPTGDLKGYRSVRAAGQRYRILYRVGVQRGVVTVAVVGIRKGGDQRDVYRVTSKRLGRKE